MTTRVTEAPPADPAAACSHFAARLAFETDCSDVHHGMSGGAPDFVLLDVRSPQLFAVSHLPGAINLPTRTIAAESLAAFPPETVFVTYCAGPHCNGSTKAALRIARLGRPVKEMIGGITGWLDEGLPLAHGAAAPVPASCGCGDT